MSCTEKDVVDCFGLNDISRHYTQIRCIVGLYCLTVLSKEMPSNHLVF